MSTTRKTLNQEARRQAAFERLGSCDPRCVICGENDWRCLEAHHLAGRNYGTETVPVCRNCHRKLSEGQRDHPVGSDGPSSLPEQVGQFLLGLADLFGLLIERLRTFGKKLIESAHHQRLEKDAP